MGESNNSCRKNTPIHQGGHHDDGYNDSNSLIYHPVRVPLPMGQGCVNKDMPNDYVLYKSVRVPLVGFSYTLVDEWRLEPK